MENIRKGNNLIRNKEVLTLSSMEVAQMLGVTHEELLQDVERRETGIIAVLKKNNIEFSKYFIPATYKLGKIKNRCYLISSEGCRILGGKLQGTENALFNVAVDKKLKEKFKTRIAENLKRDGI